MPTRPSLRAALLALVPAAAMLPTLAYAQPAPHSPPQSPQPAQQPAPGTQSAAPEAANSIREAQAHLSHALQLFRDRQYTEAIHEFELANRLSPSADLWYNIARAHELLSHYDEAIENYRRYLRDKVDPPDRALVERHINELQRLEEQQRAAARRQAVTSQLRFEVPVAGASIFLNDRSVGRSPMLQAVAVEPGLEQVRVTAPGMQEFRSTVRVRRGQTTTAFVTLQPETRYRTRSGGHFLSYILGGAGIVTLGVGAGIGISALGLAPCTFDANEMYDPMCERRDRALLGDVVMGAGILVLVGAAIAYFVEAGATHTEAVHAAPPPSRPR